MKSRLGAVCAVLLLAACGGGSAATTTQGAADSTTTSTPITGVTFSWERIPGGDPIFGGFDDQSLGTALVGGGGAIVAVGADKVEGDPDAAVWYSSEGLTWERIPHDEVLFGGASSQGMSDAVYFESAYVVVGYDYAISDAATAVVWRSANGRDWERVPHDEAIFGGTDSQIMLAVVEGGPGLVAVGWDQSGGESDAAVWTSPDGIVWSRVPHDEAVFGGAGRQSMQSVVRGGPGLVAVGDDESGGDFDAAVWTSSDGVSWQRVAPAEVFGGAGEQKMRSVHAAGPGLIAVGPGAGAEDADAQMWVSSDGTNWELVSDPAVFGGPGDQFIGGVIAVDGVLVAAGSEYYVGTDTEYPVIWFSHDGGFTWQRSQDPVPEDDRYQWVEEPVLVAGNRILLAGGIARLGDGADVAFWLLSVGQ